MPIALTNDTPFIITLPDDAVVNDSGEVVVDLSVDSEGGALADLSNVDPATGRAALGATVTGSALFTSASAADAATAIGATAAGSALLTAASSGAQLTALGATAAGTAVLTAATPAAQVTALGGTAAGAALFTSASAAAQRTSLGATAAGSAIFTAANAAAQVTALGGTAAGSALFTAATATAQRTALGVSPTTAVDLKSDIHLMGPVVVDVYADSQQTPIIWRPGFAGTIVNITMTFSGSAPVTTDPATVEVRIQGVACTTSAPLTAPVDSPTGFSVDVSVTAGGAFTANDLLTVAPTSASLSFGFACVGLEYTRA